MNIYLLAAGILTLLAFFVHTIVGDREIRMLMPEDRTTKTFEVWTMARCGWHWISADLLIAGGAMMVINFTDLLPHEALIIRSMAFLFFAYMIAWFLSIIISPRFPARFFKLGQWMLLLTISALLFVS